MSSLKQDYQNAFMSLVQSGEEIGKSVKRLKAVMEKRGHAGLLLGVLRSAVRELDRTNVADAPRLTVAREKDVKKYGQRHKDAEIIVDATIVGGYRFEKDHTIVDNTYKTKLLNWYRTATTN
jgi:F0F1-type ATP synthase delta subunit